MYVLGQTLILNWSQTLPSLSQSTIKPKYPPPALIHTWYASQTNPTLNSGKGSGATIWMENTTLFVREGKNTGIRAYRAMMCPHTELYLVICHRWQVKIRPTPREQCNSKIASRMQNFRCLRVVRSRSLDSFHIHGSHLQQTFPGEHKPSAQPLVVTNGCCWMLLSLAAVRPWLFPVSEFHFIEQSAIVRHSIIALNAAIG